MIAKRYQFTDYDFIHVYASGEHTFVGLPTEIKKQAKHIAQASYQKGNQRNSISVYLLTKENQKKINQSKLKIEEKEFRACNDLELKEIQKRYAITIQYLSDAPKEIFACITTDVQDFVKDNFSQQTLNHSIEEVKELVPKLIPQYSTEAAKIITKGKNDYVPSCLINANIDLISSSCPALLEQGYYNWENQCQYCYAKHTHRQSPLIGLKKVNEEFLLEQLVEISKKLKATEYPKNESGMIYLRFGKLSETADQSTIEEFEKILKVCIKTNQTKNFSVRPIIPTKFLRYDQNIAKLLQQSQASLLYSIGVDELEPGVVMSGCDNQSRIERAIQYYEQGVNVTFYQLIEASNFENKLFKPTLEKTLSLHQQRGIPIQFLPIRPYGKEQLARITETPRHNLKLILEGQKDFFEDDEKEAGLSYQKMGNNQYTARRIDPIFLRLIKEKGISMCHHNSQWTWCGGCGHQDKMQINTEQIKNGPREKVKKKKVTELPLFKEQ